MIFLITLSANENECQNTILQKSRTVTSHEFNHGKTRLWRERTCRIEGGDEGSKEGKLHRRWWWLRRDWTFRRSKDRETSKGGGTTTKGDFWKRAAGTEGGGGRDNFDFDTDFFLRFFVCGLGDVFFRQMFLFLVILFWIICCKTSFLWFCSWFLLLIVTLGFESFSLLLPSPPEKKKEVISVRSLTETDIYGWDHRIFPEIINVFFFFFFFCCGLRFDRTPRFKFMNSKSQSWFWIPNSDF